MEKRARFSRKRFAGLTAAAAAAVAGWRALAREPALANRPKATWDESERASKGNYLGQ